MPSAYKTPTSGASAPMYEGQITFNPQPVSPVGPVATESPLATAAGILLQGVQTATTTANEVNQNRASADAARRRAESDRKQDLADEKRLKAEGEEQTYKDFSEAAAEANLMDSETNSQERQRALYERAMRNPSQKVREHAQNALATLNDQKRAADKTASTSAETARKEAETAANATARDLETVRRKLSVGKDTPEPPPPDFNGDRRSLENWYIAAMADDAREAGMPLDIDEVGFPKDPVLLKALSTSARQMAAEHLLAEHQDTLKQRQEMVNQEANHWAFAPVSAPDRIEGFESYLKANGKPEDRDKNMGQMVDQLTASIKTELTARRVSPVDAIKSIEDAKSKLGSLGYQAQFNDKLDAARSGALKQIADMAQTRVYQASGVTSNYALWLATPMRGDHNPRIDKLLLVEADRLGINRKGTESSILDIDRSPLNLGPIQAELLDTLNDLRQKVVSEGRATPGYNPDIKGTPKEIRDDFRMGRVPDSAKANDVWKVMFSRGAVTATADDADLAEMLATHQQLTGDTNKTLDDAKEAMKVAGPEGQWLRDAAAVMDARTFNEAQAPLPSQTMTDLLNALKSDKTEDVQWAASFLRELNPNSTRFLNAVAQLDQEEQADTVALVNVLLSPTSFGGLPVQGNDASADARMTQYMTLRRGITSYAQSDSRNSDQRWINLYGSKDRSKRDEKIIAAMKNAELLDKGNKSSSLALNPWTTSALENIAVSLYESHPEQDREWAWKSALQVLESNGTRFASAKNRDGKTIVYDIQDPLRHYEKPSEYEDRIYKQMTRVVPTDDDPESQCQQLKRYFGIPAEENTKLWTVWDYVKRGNPQLHDYDLTDIRFGVDWVGHDADLMMTRDDRWSPDHPDRTVNLASTWLGGGGVITLNHKDAGNELQGVTIKGKPEFGPFTWSHKSLDIAGMHKQPNAWNGRFDQKDTRSFGRRAADYWDDIAARSGSAESYRKYRESRPTGIR